MIILTTAYIFRFSLRSSVFQQHRANFTKIVREYANLPPDSSGIPNRVYIVVFIRQLVAFVVYILNPKTARLLLRRLLYLLGKKPVLTAVVFGSFFTLFPIVMLAATRRTLQPANVALIVMTLLLPITMILAFVYWSRSASAGTSPIQLFMKAFLLQNAAQRSSEVTGARSIARAPDSRYFYIAIFKLVVYLAVLPVVPSVILWTYGANLARQLKISLTLIICTPSIFWLTVQLLPYLFPTLRWQQMGAMIIEWERVFPLLQPFLARLKSRGMIHDSDADIYTSSEDLEVVESVDARPHRAHLPARRVSAESTDRPAATDTFGVRRRPADIEASGDITSGLARMSGAR